MLEEDGVVSEASIKTRLVTLSATFFLFTLSLFLPKLLLKINVKIMCNEKEVPARKVLTRKVLTRKVLKRKVLLSLFLLY